LASTLKTVIIGTSLLPGAAALSYVRLCLTVVGHAEAFSFAAASDGS